MTTNQMIFELKEMGYNDNQIVLMYARALQCAVDAHEGLDVSAEHLINISRDFLVDNIDILAPDCI